MHRKKLPFTNTQTIFFIVILSTICASVLSILASALKIPKEEAKITDRSEQLLLAARMFSHQGWFLVQKDAAAAPAFANYDTKSGELRATDSPRRATKAEVLAVVNSMVRPMLADTGGALLTPKEAGISIDEYVNEHKKSGFQGQKYFPIYEVYSHPQAAEGSQQQPPLCYVIPVSGFGLWDYIIGFIAIKPDGKSVQGISWYEHKETPGLGANISEADWQSQFPGKLIFIPDSNGNVNRAKDPIGITVVRGKVKEVLGSSNKALAAVDGMAGATLTGNGVTKAYKDTLELYRPFLDSLSKKKSGSETSL